jgi:tRNA A37 N6-isopentenylltransferase MiaA
MNIKQALISLYPNNEWALNGNSYSGIVWLDKSTSKPSQEELDQEIARLTAEYANTEYQRLRAQEYPPVTDYLDGVVKGDQEQIQAYIAACQAVKNKYPKPE